MRRAPLLLLVLAFLSCFALPSRAQDAPVPRPGGYVNDTAGAMGEWAEKTEALCRAIEQATTAEVAVLTVRTTGGEAPQAYAQRVFDRWGIGKKGKDNGILVLVAVDDRKMWISTGYGVEGILPDGKVGEIRDRAMLPLFREGKYGEGVYEGVSRLGDVLRGQEAPPPAPSAGSGLPFWLVLLAVIVLLWALRAFRNRFPDPGGDLPARRYRRPGGGFGGSGGGYWGGFGGGGFGGGGFGGFGGGGGGGGGAGGGW